MSRILAAVIISVVIVSLCVVEKVTINSIFAESKNYLENMVAEYESQNKASTKGIAENFKSYWNSKEKLLCLFYADSELDNISLDIASLPLLSSSNDEFLHLCSNIKNRLIFLKEHSVRVFG